MSVLIKGMKMPKCCAECDVEGHYDNSYGDEYGFFCPFGYKAYTSETRELKRLDNCPIIPVPPHGRLIDADELKKVIANAKHMDADIHDGKTMYSDHLCVGADYDDVCAAIDETPTVIPAKIISENEIKIIDTKGKSNYDPKRRFVIPTEEGET